MPNLKGILGGLFIMLAFVGNAGGAPLRDAYFAGGCFWGVEEYFSRIPGVVDVVSGYANGNSANPSYEEVCSGKTGHAETVKISYDPALVGLDTLARQFFKIIDPFSLNRQGNDMGVQYRTGMYYTDEKDRELLENILAEEQSGHDRKIAVELEPLRNFSPAEEYHQDYLRKHPGGYCHIRFDSLKDAPSIVDAKRYHKPKDADLRARLEPGEYDVSQRGATEPPFSGKFWNNKARGIYVDVATGEPLFLSSDKFDSGTGWPSFTRPLDPAVLKYSRDSSLGMSRVEVRSRVGDSHLGHVFEDGPALGGGLRYCINSAALRFIPLEEMDKAGYGYLKNLVK